MLALLVKRGDFLLLQTGSRETSAELNAAQMSLHCCKSPVTTGPSGIWVVSGSLCTVLVQKSGLLATAAQPEPL